MTNYIQIGDWYYEEDKFHDFLGCRIGGTKVDPSGEGHTVKRFECFANCPVE